MIPEKFKERNLIGYRVEVPFGTRVVQGYVVSVSKKYNGEYDKNNFKSIKKLKDDFPILTKEMLLLSKVMADELFCTRIQAIETLIPTILKNKYIEYYELIDANKTLLYDYAKYFDKNNLVEKKKFEKIFSIEQIGYLISLKAIKLISKVKEINNNIMEEFYILGDISNVKLTKKQQIIVDYLSNNKKIKKSDVKEILNIGPSVTKKLLEQNVIFIIEEEVIPEIDTTILQNETKLSKYQKEIFDKIVKNYNISFMVLQVLERLKYILN